MYVNVLKYYSHIIYACKFFEIIQVKGGGAANVKLLTFHYFIILSVVHMYHRYSSIRITSTNVPNVLPVAA